jgi:hypothetical protein
MGNYPLLNIYRIMLILIIIGVLGYALFGPHDLYDGGTITFDEYIETYVPPALVIVGLLAMIQLIGTVIELSNRQHESYHLLLDKNKLLTEQIRQLEKSTAEFSAALRKLEKSDTELKGMVQRSISPINAIGKRLD